MICPNCSSENRPGAKFCDECGASLHDAATMSETAETHDLPSASGDTIVLPPADDSDAPTDHATTEEKHERLGNAPALNASGKDDEKADGTCVEDQETQETLSAEATVDLKKLREMLPETKLDEETYGGLEHSNYEEMALATPWDAGATMKMKPVGSANDSDDSKQRTFVSFEDDTKPHRSRKPLAITAAIVVLAACVAFATWYFELWGGYKVPDVVGMSQEAATSVLAEKGLNVRIEHVKSDDEEGVVLLTDPQAGRRMQKGGEVVLHVSVPRTIPSILGMGKEEAEKKLQSEGFTNISFKSTKSNDPEDTVLSVSPEVGEKAKAAYPITVTIAEPYRVPDVVGKSAEEATSILEEAGYAVSVTRVYTEQQTEGTVIESSPAADEKLDSGETVTISVAVSRERELVNAAQAAFAQGTHHTVGGVAYEVSSLSSVTYEGGNATTINVVARPYTVFLGVTMYLDPADYTWNVSWSSDNQVASIS